MITVVIVGAGIGAEHLRGYAALPDQYRVKAICDLNEERAQATASIVPGTDVMTDMALALADPEVDVIDICLPSNLHFAPAMQALAAGKSVVIEKPIAASLSEADQLAEQAAKAGKHVFPVFQYRYGTGAAQLHALSAAGLTGKPYVATLETHWNRGGSYYDTPWRGTFKGEMGGVLVTHAIHIHDLLPVFFGPLARVYAEVQTSVNPVEAEDCSALTFRFENGALATSSVTLGAAQDTSRLRMVFEHVTVESDTAPYAPAAARWRFTARDADMQPQIDACVNGVTDQPQGFVGFFQAMSEAIAGRGGSQVTLQDGRRSLEVATAAYASARLGRAETIPVAKDHPMYHGWLPDA